jgi:hypothetical protein
MHLGERPTRRRHLSVHERAGRKLLCGICLMFWALCVRVSTSALRLLASRETAVEEPKGVVATRINQLKLRYHPF